MITTPAFFSGSISVSDGSFTQSLIRAAKPVVSASDALLSSQSTELPIRLTFRDGAPLDFCLLQNGAEPSWHWSLFHQLQALARLGENWDSYGAKPISRSAVRRLVLKVLDLLPSEIGLPNVVPMRDGGVQLEWSKAPLHFELAVRPDGPIEYYFASENDATLEQEWEGSPEQLRSKLRGIIAALKAQ